MSTILTYKCSSESLLAPHMQHIQVSLGNSNCTFLLSQASQTQTGLMLIPIPPVAPISVIGSTIYITPDGTLSTYVLSFRVFPLVTSHQFFNLPPQHLIPPPHSHTTSVQIPLSSCLD